MRLDFAQKEFIFEQSAADTREYGLRIETIELHIPLATLNPDIDKHLMAKWDAKENLVNVHFRRYNVVMQSIGQSLSSFSYNLINAGQPLPSRICIGFIKASERKSKNFSPFSFQRSFKNDRAPASPAIFVKNIRVQIDSEKLGKQIPLSYLP